MRNCSQRVSMVLAMTACVVFAQAGIKGRENLRVESRIDTKAIQAPIRYEVSRTVSTGRIVKSHDGTPGSIKRTYEVTFRDGKPVSKKLLNEERVEPKPTLFLIGKAGFTFSRGAFVRHKVLNMFATGYYSYVCGTGRTATGQRAKFGVVAVDPRVIPLGSVVYVEGYGLALACDTGGAIKGNRIDLCFESNRKANGYSSHYVRVHVLH